MEIEALLKVALRGGASEVLLKTGSAPRFRFNNEVVPLNEGREIPNEIFQAWIEKLLPPHLTKRVETLGDAHFSWTSRYGVRFRIFIFRQRQKFSMILRVIPPQIPSLVDLRMPEQVTNLTKESSGLVVLAGPARAVKSTLMASMLNTINATRAGHILTIEDPIEYVFSDQRSVVEQREVGIDTPSFEKGLKAALQHRPDVLAISDLRDKETLELALQAAQGGSLVLLPMTAMSCADALERLQHQWHSTLDGTTSHYLASCLRAIVSLTPVRRIDGRGFIAAPEVLANTARLQGWLLGKANGESGWAFVKTLLSEKNDPSQLSLERSLATLVFENIIAKEEALNRSENEDEFLRSVRRLG